MWKKEEKKIKIKEKIEVGDWKIQALIRSLFLSSIRKHQHAAVNARVFLFCDFFVDRRYRFPRPALEDSSPFFDDNRLSLPPTSFAQGSIKIFRLPHKFKVPKMEHKRYASEYPFRIVE